MTWTKQTRSLMSKIRHEYIHTLTACVRTDLKHTDYFRHQHVEADHKLLELSLDPVAMYCQRNLISKLADCMSFTMN